VASLVLGRLSELGPPGVPGVSAGGESTTLEIDASGRSVEDTGGATAAGPGGSVFWRDSTEGSHRSCDTPEGLDGAPPDVGESVFHAYTDMTGSAATIDDRRDGLMERGEYKEKEKKSDQEAGNR
jgi:hypothetical protein